MYGLQPYWFQVVDEFGLPVASDLSVAIDIAGAGAATIYADATATAKSNPITSTPNGEVSFFYAAATCDVVVTRSYASGAGVTSVASLTPKDHRVVAPTRYAVS